MKGGDAVGIQKTMKAIADPTRRTILDMLKKRSLSAGEIAENFEMSMPAVSKHLNVLKDADLIRDRRDGKYIYYELNASVLDEVLLWLSDFRGDENEKA
ncbi:MAG: winged helix-turn-helix transcriptional regulator [Clostridia bacterium]|jgi:DNA-binding transcriptional ArsR family regulator|nr:winged helix-turn-helix transcriptional regulator [Clostridia bacterium]